MKHTALFILMLIPVLMIGTAHAQTASVGAPPPAAELALPSGAAPAVTKVTTTTTTPAPGKMDAQADTATGMPNDPCPNLKGATQNAPSDMSGIQQDIDRFTLCVQRGQLLERLNETATKSIQGTDAALGLGGAANGGLGMGGALPTNMPPLPANALGGADVSPMAPAPSTTASSSNTSVSDSTGGWTIKEIYGSTVDMQARLISPDGDEVKVKKGTKLPNSSVVTSITPDGVSVRGGKGVRALEWAKS